MTAWVAAALAASLLAALAYLPAAGVRDRVVLALLRAVAVLLLAAAALDAPLGRARRPAPLVVLDASASWSRAAGSQALAAARDSVRAIGSSARDSLLLAGDSTRRAEPALAGRDGASRVGDAADRAAAAGRALVVVTDGEVDDAASLTRAPRGSRIIVVRPDRGVDAAVLAADAPRAVSARDTVDVRVTLGADAAGAPPGRVRLLLGPRVLADSARVSLGPFARAEVRMRAPLANAPAGAQVIRVVAATSGDREPRNDTLALAVDVSDAPAAVFVSGAPDYDARLLLGILRGTLGTPVRAYLRVAPGQWRSEGTLAAVAEADVRRAAAAASLLVVHGDTAALGPPRALGGAALALVAPPAAADTSAEWYATAAPPSPVQGALADVAWDSLPPLDVGPSPSGTWTGLTARLGRGTGRGIVAGSDAARRVLVVGAGGFWRWQFRGGRPAEAATALWGALFDWLAAGRGDARAAVPELAAVRGGQPVRWRRGGTDSVVVVRIARAGGAAGAIDTLVLRFSGGARAAESAALPPGVYTVSGTGGASTLAVNSSAEVLPRRPSVASGPVGSAAVAEGDVPRLRDAGWPYALAVVALCLEWVLRRRRGLR